MNVAKTFDDLLEITGVILTKLDGDTRGRRGFIHPLCHRKAIKFAGVGEKLSDIEAFHPDRMAFPDFGHGGCALPH